MASSYREYEKEAHDLVQVILSSSLDRFQQEQEEARTEERREWPTGANLTPETGLRAIEGYIKVLAVSTVRRLQN